MPGSELIGFFFSDVRSPLSLDSIVLLFIRKKWEKLEIMDIESDKDPGLGCKWVLIIEVF